MSHFHHDFLKALGISIDPVPCPLDPKAEIIGRRVRASISGSTWHGKEGVIISKESATTGPPTGPVYAVRVDEPPLGWEKDEPAHFYAYQLLLIDA